MAKYHSKLSALAKQVHNVMTIAYNYTNTNKQQANLAAIALALLIHRPTKAKKIRKLTNKVRDWYRNTHLYGYQFPIAMCVSKHKIFQDDDFKYIKNITKDQIISACKEAKKRPDLLQHTFRLVDFI